MKKILNYLIFGVLSLFYGSFFIMLSAIFFILYFIAKYTGLRKIYLDFSFNVFFHVTSAFLGFYFYEPIIISYNKKILESKRNIIISNHITLYDWFFFFVLLKKFNKLSYLKIILKKSLESVPFFGYVMKLYGFIFLNRKLKEDEKILEERMREITDEEKYSILFFPEGTVIENGTREVSKNYAQQNNVLVDGKEFCHDRVLLPKKTGFNIILKELKTFDGIIDCTIGTVPYERYPYQTFTFTEVFLEKKRSHKYFFVLDYKENNKNLYEDTFLYKDFFLKNDFLERVENNNVSNVSDLYNLHKNFIDSENISDIVFDEVCIWKNIYYLLIGGYFTLVGLAFYKLYKFLIN
ncbi:hypothetical protein H311_03411 [Anncaliia algerae PRA109]|nr:hypothetical protein H311_03411 [Anncaliia algerae PRA109]